MKEDDPLIDGGSTTDDDKGRPQVGPAVGAERHRQIVTLVLIGLLAVVILGHYATITVLEWNVEKSRCAKQCFQLRAPRSSGAGRLRSYVLLHKGSQPEVKARRLPRGDVLSQILRTIT